MLELKAGDELIVDALGAPIFKAMYIGEDKDRVFSVLATLITPFSMSWSTYVIEAGEQVRIYRSDIAAVNGVNVHTGKPYRHYGSKETAQESDE